MQGAHTQETSTSRRVIKAGFTFTVLLVVVVTGSIATGSELGLVTRSVESLSADSSSLLSRVGLLFPLGFAFTAGMVASVNPCGFAMLPAYLGLYVGEDVKGAAGVSSRIERAITVASAVTAGFILVFALIGLPIALGARSLVSVFPWIGLAVGMLLMLASAYLLAGGVLYSNAALRLSASIIPSHKNRVLGYFTFGLAYGIASLSCTLPIFLAVIGGTFTSDTFLDSIFQFLLYGLGMGTVILLLTVGIALFKTTTASRLRNLLPYANKAGAAMLLVSGAFIVYYWLTIGELLERIR